jgi:protein-disulfide reductase (glutathione)
MLKRYVPVLCCMAGCLVGLGACKGDDTVTVRPLKDTSANPPTRPTTVSTATTATTATAPHKANGPKAAGIHWTNNIAWQTWEAGLAQAKASNKPIMVVVFANWCVHCKKLAPMFDAPELIELSKKFVMIKQNSDEDAAWLQGLRSGTYVPRVLFLNTDGTLRTDYQSGNRRYPYFYTPEEAGALKGNMRRATGS